MGHLACCEYCLYSIHNCMRFTWRCWDVWSMSCLSWCCIDLHTPLLQEIRPQTRDSKPQNVLVRNERAFRMYFSPQAHVNTRSLAESSPKPLRLFWKPFRLVSLWKKLWFLWCPVNWRTKWCNYMLWLIITSICIKMQSIYNSNKFFYFVFFSSNHRQEAVVALQHGS